jgi:excisionase family DNA binding protein
MTNNPFQTIDERLNKIESLLQDLKQLPTKSDNVSDVDELLTVKETAKFLRLSTPTIYSLISKGELPYQKRTKRVYFSKHDLLNYLKVGRRKTNTEIANEAEQYLKTKKG